MCVLCACVRYKDYIAYLSMDVFNTSSPHGAVMSMISTLIFNIHHPIIVNIATCLALRDHTGIVSMQWQCTSTIRKTTRKLRHYLRSVFASPPGVHMSLILGFKNASSHEPRDVAHPGTLTI